MGFVPASKKGAQEKVKSEGGGFVFVVGCVLWIRRHDRPRNVWLGYSLGTVVRRGTTRNEIAIPSAGCSRSHPASRRSKGAAGALTFSGPSLWGRALRKRLQCARALRGSTEKDTEKRAGQLQEAPHPCFGGEALRGDVETRGCRGRRRATLGRRFVFGSLRSAFAGERQAGDGRQKGDRCPGDRVGDARGAVRLRSEVGRRRRGRRVL